MNDYEMSYYFEGEKDINLMKTIKTVVLEEPQFGVKNKTEAELNNTITGLVSEGSKIEDEKGESIFSFKGGFETAQTFEPYEGYYFFNSDYLETLHIPYLTNFLKMGEVSNDPFKWKVEILLTSGENNDNSTWLGVTDNASPTTIS